MTKITKNILNQQIASAFVIQNMTDFQLSLFTILRTLSNNRFAIIIKMTIFVPSILHEQTTAKARSKSVG